MPATTAAGAVEAAAERLHGLMVEPERQRLETLIAPELSYGHSSGKVDTRESLIDTLTSGASGFQSIAIGEQSVQIAADDLAIVRHRFVADTNGKGKAPARVDLRILQIWKKNGGEWQLLARQAVTAGA